MPDPERPRPTRAEPREVTELRSVKARHPELADVVDMQLELFELQRRVQGRVPLPWLELSSNTIHQHQTEGRPLLRFEAIPLELTDLRLLVRQTADVLRRHGVLDEPDYLKVQAAGRDMQLLARAADWYRQVAESHALSPVVVGRPVAEGLAGGADALSEVLALAMRPFLSRCAEVLQQRPELGLWTHPHCPLCGAQPDFSVITPAAERHLICSRCALRWKFEPLTCPYCRNADRSRITSFAAHLGEHDYRVYACDVCHRFLKAFDARRASRSVMPIVDAIATLPLDAAAVQRGYTA